MLKLKLQHFGHMLQRADSFEKTLMLGKIEGRRRRGWQDEMAGWYHWHSEHGFGWTSGVGDGQRGLVCCSSWGHKGKKKLKNEKNKEGWAPKNWCSQTVVLEKTLESPMESKENKPVSPKGNQPWMFIGRTDSEGDAPILCPSDAESWLTGKDSDVGRSKAREGDNSRWDGWMALLTQ